MGELFSVELLSGGLFSVIHERREMVESYYFSVETLRVVRDKTGIVLLFYDNEPPSSDKTRDKTKTALALFLS